MKRNGIFRQSTTDSVHTPEYILKYVRKHWGEDLYDPCPFNPEFDPKIHQDGLKTNWKSPAFVNPPFSRNKKFDGFYNDRLLMKDPIVLDRIKSEKYSVINKK